MDGDCEIIALLLDEADDGAASGSVRVKSAQCLVRDAKGHVTLHAVGSQAELDETARTSACFRRGKEIRDPLSHEVIGYEMEAVSVRPATAGSR